ncbi:MAG: aspartate--tRNA(Asn) ligase [Bacilli bacterium]|jgi:nondiscriminating aspartyl-tRNA synthetase
MKIKTLENLPRYLEREIIVVGFIDSIRDLPYVQFIILRNQRNKLQITLEKNEENKDLNSLISSLRIESTIEVKGLLKSNDKVKLNGLELLAKEIKITSYNQEELPLNLKDKFKALRETRLDYRFLDLRREEANLIFQVQTTFTNALREYWLLNDYIELFTPKLLGTASESGADVFKLDYFGKEAFLAQSPQFYKQMAMASNFNKVFEIAPAFRAEKSHTSYHATEFTSIDAEISWLDSHHEVMDILEETLIYSLSKVKEKHQEEIKRYFNVTVNIPKKIPRLPFNEVKQIIKDQYQYIGPKETDIDRKEEELICHYVKNKYQSELVYIIDYPLEPRPFYHMLNEEGLTKSFDLIYKGIEITTGAQREHRYDVLKKQALEKGLSLKEINFYLDFFKYGCPPHGGYGLGLTRTLMQLLEIDNVREVTFLYRGPNRLTP